MSNSSLIQYTRISPNKTPNRYMYGKQHSISKITIHHMAGVMTLEGFGNIVANPAREMSSNYAIGNDGRIGLFCDEKDRSWCSSSPANDLVSVTIEVSNSSVGGDWPIGTKAYNSLIKLCVDICKRNGIKKLYFDGTPNGSLTFHYMFASTACLPIDRTELLTPFGWKLLKDIHIGDVVATVHIDNLGIKFDGVENVIPVKTQDTYVMRDFEGTSDHRVVYYNQAGRQYVGQYKDLYDKYPSIYIPNAGFIENPEGFRGLGSADIEFLVAVQADGHYMTDGNCRYGVEFHLKKNRKIKRLKNLFEVLNYKYTVCEQSDGTTKLRLYGTDFVEKCEDYLDNKCFTWEWLNMNRKQVEYFMEAILQYDGCEANKSYSSAIQQNVDIVQAIAAINGIGTKMTKEHNRVYFKKFMRTLGNNTRVRKTQQQVSCVTVRSGFILIRQHGRTTITGNCPGPWMKNHTTDLCNKVNAQLNSSSSTTKPQPTQPTTSFKVGNLVKINAGARYYGGGAIPQWVVNEKWYISSISGDRAVLGLNEAKNRNILSPIHAKDITLAQTQTSTFKEYTKSFKGTDKIYGTAGGSVTGTIGASGIYTIVDEKTVGTVTYGKLKSGKGWVIVRQQDIQIKKGDKVKVKSGKNYIYGTNNKFTMFVSVYTVLEVNGDRIVISSDGIHVTTAINKNNLEKA